ncbi:MAG: serine kinase [Pseudomonadota bacterium]
MDIVHGTAVSIDGAGVLFRGLPGAGKSDLALRFVDSGAMLIADDRVVVARSDGGVTAAAPETIAGRLEVRGFGIVTLPHAAATPLRLVVDLVSDRLVERLPKPAETMLLDVAVPLLELAPFEASTPAKIRLALRLSSQEIER